MKNREKIFIGMSSRAFVEMCFNLCDHMYEWDCYNCPIFDVCTGKKWDESEIINIVNWLESDVEE